MMVPHRQSSRWTIGLWVVLGLVCVVLFGTTVHDELGELGGDGAMYVLLAESIATGQGYQDLVDPDQRPHTLYPPVFPLMLSPLVALYGPHAFRPMHILVVGCAVAAVLLAVLLLRGEGEQAGAWLAGWATAVHPFVIAFLLAILSDVPYLLYSVLALYGLQRYRSTTTISNRWLWLAGGAAAVLTRSVGWALVPAAVCGLWPHRRVSGPPPPQGTPALRRRQLAAWLIVSLTLPVLWAVRNACVPEPPWAQYTYWRELPLVDPRHPELGAVDAAAFLQRLGDGVMTYLKPLMYVLGEGRWPRPVGPLLAILAGWGWCLRWWRRRSAIEWYVLWYVVMILVFPWRAMR